MAGRDDLALTETARARVADVFESNRRYIEAIAIQQVGGDQTEAAEVVQDVALRLCRKLETFRHSAALRTWLYRVTVNAARDRMAAARRRSRGRVEFVDDADLEAARAAAEPAQIINPDDVVAARERRELIARAVAGLPRKERQVLRARFGLGAYRGDARSLAETGQELGASISNVHRTEAAGLERLRARFDKRRAKIGEP